MLVSKIAMDETIFCSNCGEKNSSNGNFCVGCGSLLHNFEKIKPKPTINSLDELYTSQNEELLKDGEITEEALNLILENIKEIGKNKYNPSEFGTTFEKVSDIVNTFSSWQYKSKGGELGSYCGNSIQLDDRLDDSEKIATLIHELAHHLLAEIVEEIAIYLLEVEKTSTIEALVNVMLIRQDFAVMNEYCAHTVEGRFIPFGYQNYGSFNKLLDETKLDDDEIGFSFIVGNTFANIIIAILEEFIDSDLREEIKLQYKKDNIPLTNSEIALEVKETMDLETLLLIIVKAIYLAFKATKDSEDIQNLLMECKNKF